jgi:glutaredoxin
MRMRFLAPLLLLLPLLPLPLPAQAQMYRWVDDSGKVHYSDQAPSSGAKNVQKRSLSAGQGSSAALPYALQQSVRNFPVTLYTAEACGETCAQARELLNKRGVPYSEVAVTDAPDLTQLKELSGGNVVPVMTVGREVYKGFESGAYKAALDAAGYPTSSLLPPGIQARQPVTKPVQKAAPAAAEAGGRPATAPQETVNTATPK